MQLDKPKPVREAASLILVSDSAEGVHVFMLKRPGRGNFPDLHVFPGGTVDDDDTRLIPKDESIWRSPYWATDLAFRFRIAAIRECFEESGVLFVKETEQAPDNATAEHNRELIMNHKLSFAKFVLERNLVLNYSKIHYFSHWITPRFAPARFDTRFFLAEIPEAQVAKSHDAETVGGSWIKPEDALRYYALNQWQMIVPTLTTLRMISGYRSVEHLITAVERGQHRIPVTNALHAKGMQFYT